jgi:hypothetical protein
MVSIEKSVEITEEEFDKFLEDKIKNKDSFESSVAYFDLEEKNDIKKNVDLKYYKHKNYVYWVIG